MEGYSGLEIDVETYDPDKDVESSLGGAGGHRLADAIMRVTNGHPETFGTRKELSSEEINELESYQIIASRRDSGVKGIKKILSDLMGAGYEVEQYSHMNKEEVLKYIRVIRSNISERLGNLHWMDSF